MLFLSVVVGVFGFSGPLVQDFFEFDGFQTASGDGGAMVVDCDQGDTWNIGPASGTVISTGGGGGRPGGRPGGGLRGGGSSSRIDYFDSSLEAAAVTVTGADGRRIDLDVPGERTLQIGNDRTIYLAMLSFDCPADGATKIALDGDQQSVAVFSPSGRSNLVFYRALLAAFVMYLVSGVLIVTGRHRRPVTTGNTPRSQQFPGLD